MIFNNSIPWMYIPNIPIDSPSSGGSQWEDGKTSMPRPQTAGDPFVETLATGPRYHRANK